MGSSQINNTADPLYFGYRERTRALLRHLLLERGLNPNHPMVTAYDHHLCLTTAHAEYTRVAEQDQGADLKALRTVCFRGCDLKFAYCDRTATPLSGDGKEED